MTRGGSLTTHAYWHAAVSRLRLAIFAGAMGGAIAGCGGPSGDALPKKDDLKQDTAKQGGDEKPAEVKMLDLAMKTYEGNLPELKASNFQHDETRVGVPRLNDWYSAISEEPPPERLRLFILSEFASNIPSIELRVTSYPKLSRVTSENVEQFAERRAAELIEKQKKTKLKEPVQPITIRGFVGVSYVRKTKTKAKGILLYIDRLHVETVFDGWLFTVELAGTRGMVDKYRLFAYALAAGWEFPQDEVKLPEKKEDGEKEDGEKEDKDRTELEKNDE